MWVNISASPLRLIRIDPPGLQLLNDRLVFRHLAQAAQFFVLRDVLPVAKTRFTRLFECADREFGFPAQGQRTCRVIEDSCYKLVFAIAEVAEVLLERSHLGGSLKE